MQQRGSRLDGIQQVVQYGAQAILCSLILCQLPRFRLVDVFVASLEEIEYLRQRIRDTQAIHFLRHFADRSRNKTLQVLINALVIRNAPVTDGSAKVFIAHRNRAVHQVAHRVGELGVPALNHQVIGNDSVIFKRHLMYAEIPDRIHIENVSEVVRIDHVAFGFAHFAAALKKPRMAEHLLRKRQVEGHQENRPVDRMETDDVLADQVEIRRPELFKLLRRMAVRIIADARDIVGQGIQPHITYMARGKVDGYAPGK